MNMAQSETQAPRQHPLQPYIDRYQALQQYSDSKDALIQELLMGWSQAASELTQENDELKQKLHNAQLDLEDAVNTRRELQTKVSRNQRELERCAQHNDGLKNRNPYVMVLIDGDGLIFKDDMIRLGIEGGKKAAYALRSAITEHLDGQHGTDVEVMAKAVANVHGLSRVMKHEGSIQEEKDMKDFALGFTQAKASFDFIDVGYGKERADSKIKELTRWNLRNSNCKHVFLGVSHDSGYAPFLDEILQDEDTRQRVTLLEGVPTVRELKATGVNIHTDLADSMFRREKIVLSNSNGHANGYANGFTNEQGNGSNKEGGSPSSRSASLRSASPSAPGISATNSWAGITTRAASPPPKITTPLAHRLAPSAVRAKEEPVKWSPGARGLDPPVSTTQDALNSVKNRDKDNRFCNHFFGRGYCPRRTNGCPFVHDAEPTPEELEAIKFLTRINPCEAGQDCYVQDCMYGHNCPLVKDGVCPHPTCRFPKDLHPPGTRFANRKIDYN